MTHAIDKLRMNQPQVLRSSTASRVWSHLHFRFTIPIWFARSRSMAISFSPSLRKLASMGESGIQIKAMTENARERQPQYRKMICCIRQFMFCSHVRRLERFYLIRFESLTSNVAQTICRQTSELAHYQSSPFLGTQHHHVYNLQLL
jgi:hypothetical protein